MRPRRGKANKEENVSTDESADEQCETIHIAAGATTAGEFLRRQGTYRYEREDGATVHGGNGRSMRTPRSRA
jgi:hypothetical protein